MGSAATNLQDALKNAELLYKEANYEAAKEIYKSILQLEMKNEAALKGLGSCLYNLRQYESALRCFQALEKIFNRENAKMWIYASLISLGKTSEAKKLAKSCENIEVRVKNEGICLDYY